MVSLWSRLWPQDGHQNCPQSGPNICTKIIIIFGSSFFEPLELFRCLLGAFLGLPRLSWTALEPPKHIKNCRFLIVLQMQVFWTLTLLTGLLGPILAPLGPIWSQNLSSELPQKWSKKCPKHDPRNNKKSPIVDPKLDPKIA